MKKFINNYWPLIILLVLSFGAIRNLLAPGYFSIHDDLQVMRLLEMVKCLSDGQIPCRWVPDMGYGYGFPLFNFYPPGPYYLGAFIKLVFSLSLIDTIKVLFGLSFILSGIFMYLLAKTFWGRLGGLVSAILFVYAPYHAVDVYVRGAMNEAWGITFFPIIFYTLYNLARTGQVIWLVLSALSLFALFVSHNIMTLIFTPWALVWYLIWVFIFKRWKHLIGGAASFVLGIGLAGFFLLPALLEQHLVQISNLTSDYFYYGSHFASFSQLFLQRSWGYGPSEYGPNDKISFQIGYPHWWILAFILGLLFVFRRWKVLGWEKLILCVFLLGGFLSSALMAHAKSYPIWQSFPTLQFTQFPWRFLSLVIFFNGLLGGALLALVNQSRIKIITFIIIITVILFLNAGYFDFERHYYNLDDAMKLSGEDLRLQKQAGILDYLPKTVKEIPEVEAPFSVNILAGEADVRYFDKRTDYFGLGVEVFGQKEATFQIPIFEFPDWVVVKNNNEVIPHTITSDFGLVTVTLPPGKHDIAGWFTNTPLRMIANAMTALSFLTLLSLLTFGERKR